MALMFDEHQLNQEGDFCANSSDCIGLFRKKMLILLRLFYILFLYGSITLILVLISFHPNASLTTNTLIFFLLPREPAFSCPKFLPLTSSTKSQPLSLLLMLVSYPKNRKKAELMDFVTGHKLWTFWWFYHHSIM